VGGWSSLQNTDARSRIASSVTTARVASTLLRGSELAVDEWFIVVSKPFNAKVPAVLCGDDEFHEKT
jgi:hypothetical protein